MSEQFDVGEFLKIALIQPKEVMNDAGRVETHDIDKLVKAAQFLQKYNAAQADPLSCLRQDDLPNTDCWIRR